MFRKTSFASFKELFVTVGKAFAHAWAEQSGVSATQRQLWENQIVNKKEGV